MSFCQPTSQALHTLRGTHTHKSLSEALRDCSAIAPVLVHVPVVLQPAHHGCGRLLRPQLHQTRRRTRRISPRPRERTIKTGDDGLQQGLDAERIISVARDERLAQFIERRRRRAHESY